MNETKHDREKMNDYDNLRALEKKKEEERRRKQIEEKQKER